MTRAIGLGVWVEGTDVAVQTDWSAVDLSYLADARMSEAEREIVRRAEERFRKLEQRIAAIEERVDGITGADPALRGRGRAGGGGVCGG